MMALPPKYTLVATVITMMWLVVVATLCLIYGLPPEGKFIFNVDSQSSLVASYLIIVCGQFVTTFGLYQIGYWIINNPTDISMGMLIGISCVWYLYLWMSMVIMTRINISTSGYQLAVVMSEQLCVIISTIVRYKQAKHEEWLKGEKHFAVKYEDIV
jgi:hypothetical protein